MYNLEQFHFVEVKEQKKDEIVCLIEHEDSKELLEFVVDHEKIEEYYGDCGFYDYIVDPAGDYEDVCSNLFIDLKESENSESINGLHVRAVKKVKRPFWEFVIDNINSSFIPRKSTDTEAFLQAYQRKVKAVEYKAVFL